jgi:hypothetical protein
MAGVTEKQIFRYWIEIRDLASGVVRTLPLTAVMRISLARRKKNEPPIPNEELLQLKDEAEIWEAKTVDELAARLRDKYPDTTFERTLHYERDREAEERRERALNGLIELLAQRVADEMLEEESGRRLPRER